MLRNKRDVDKHVQDLLKKVSNENEVSIKVSKLGFITKVKKAGLKFSR